ncbi:MAG: AbrB/MazE/SpoVT family DNA-binding domain-containing protein [Stellaceae bacterium]
MKIPLRPIGNSWGVIIPKPFLEQLQMRGTVEMTLVDGTLVIAAARTVREGWAGGPSVEFTDEDRAFVDAPLDPIEIDALGEWDGAR